MKNKNILKIILLIVISILVIFVFSNQSFGIDTTYYKPSSLDNPGDAETIKDIGNTIIGFLQVLGSILSVVVLVVLGIKYMVGSVEDKAEYKKHMMPYIVGAVMVFAITNILGIIVNISKKLIY